MNAARDVGLEPATARRLFPQGGDSLLAWLDDWADRRMVEALGELEIERLPVRRRIALLVRSRLESLTAHREAIRRAVAAHGMPGNVAGTGRALWRTVDLMWRTAGLGGDPKDGFSYYSRRATLAGVVVATFLYWLDDQSEAAPTVGRSSTVGSRGCCRSEGCARRSTAGPPGSRGAGRPPRASADRAQ